MGPGQRDADGAAREKWNTKPPNVDPDGYFFAADTLAELAELAGIDSTGLVATVERYNAFTLRIEDYRVEIDFGNARFACQQSADLSDKRGERGATA